MDKIRTIFFLFMLAVAFVASPPTSSATAAESVLMPSVVLWAKGFEADAGAKVERDTIQTYEKKGIRAVSVADLIPNPERRTLLNILRHAQAIGAQAIFQITNNGGRPRRAVHVGGCNNIACNNGSILSGHIPSAQPSLGNQLQRRWTGYAVLLIDAYSMKTLWVDVVKAYGRKNSSDTFIAKKAFREAARKAIRDGYFAPGLYPENKKSPKIHAPEPSLPDVLLPPPPTDTATGASWGRSVEL